MALDIGTRSVTSKYALNNFTLPKVCAMERMLLTMEWPEVFVGAGQFSVALVVEKKEVAFYNSP